MAQKSNFRVTEKIFKRFFILQDYLKWIARKTTNALGFFFFAATIAFIVLLLIQLGFQKHGEIISDIKSYYKPVLYIIFLTKFLPKLIYLRGKKIESWISDGVLFSLSLTVIVVNFSNHFSESAIINFLEGEFVLSVTVLLLTITEAHRLMHLIESVKVAPPLLFALSFLVVILIGSGLLMLPNAHTLPISFLDSLFTSASAVCVTGLVVVDTATAFTPLGKIIIMSLIQIGGLGIMTFTGFFGYIFTGSASFKDRILLKDMITSENLGGLFRVLTKIILITFLFEIVGAIIIYFNLGEIGEEKIFFAVFHSVSAFCNAGFSTLSNGLASPVLNNNFTINMVIAMLIILGGIGFPVLLTFYTGIKNVLSKLLFRSKRYQKQKVSIAQNISSRIVVITTLLLIISGTIFYYLLENGKSLDGIRGIDKWMVAFFGSVSARTAGFNVIDISLWSYPTVFLMIFLMWVGASPGSTGGGIKTTTFAIAIRASYDFIRGRHAVEMGNREIGSETISRVLVVIVLSLVVIFLGFFGLLISEPEKNPMHLLFECFSAFGTVGLSIVNSSTLSAAGKEIIICLMFIGRLGPLTLLTGLFIPYKRKYFKYPKQDLIIN